MQKQGKKWAENMEDGPGELEVNKKKNWRESQEPT